jgi:hypothetical protein
MEIISVKQQTNGYFVNGNTFIPEANDNPYYQLILQWIADGNTPEPQFTQAELDAQVLAASIAEALQYLKDTDFYYARFLETNEAVPAEVVAERIAKRTFLRNNGY